MPAATGASAPAHTDMDQGHASRRGGSRWADLRLRVLSALVLAPMALAGVWLGQFAWGAVVSAASAGLLVEWTMLSRHAWHGRALAVATRIGAGLSYVLPSFAALLWLRQDAGSGLRNTVFLLVIVWASDVGAYLAGRLVGGPLLAPRISPGKTWAGAVGGLLAAACVGAMFAPAATGAGMVLGMVAQAGDLMESAIKRGFAVKDSGRIIPGHGGLLDRLDGLLTAAPVAAGLSWLAGPGMPLWG